MIGVTSQSGMLLDGREYLGRHSEKVMFDSLSLFLKAGKAEMNERESTWQFIPNI